MEKINDKKVIMTHLRGQNWQTHYNIFCYTQSYFCFIYAHPVSFLQHKKALHTVRTLQRFQLFSCFFFFFVIPLFHYLAMPVQTQKKEVIIGRMHIESECARAFLYIFFLFMVGTVFWCLYTKIDDNVSVVCQGDFYRMRTYIVTRYGYNVPKHT